LLTFKLAKKYNKNQHYTRFSKGIRGNSYVKRKDILSFIYVLR